MNYNRNYSVIPLDILSDARKYVRLQYPGYKIRTFYIGKRSRVDGRVAARQTLRANAVAAKLALYENGRLVKYI